MTQHRRPSVTSFMPQESAAQPTAESVLTTIVPSGMGRRQISSPFAIAPNPDQNAWLIQLEVSGSPEYNLSLTIRNEIILGRGEGENIIDLTSLDAANLGVSRRHLLLRPTLTNLFIIDLGSTNGSLRNGLPIGLNTPYPVVNGDIITLGRLSLTLTVVKRPSVQTGFFAPPIGSGRCPGPNCQSDYQPVKTGRCFESGRKCGYMVGIGWRGQHLVSR